MSNYFTVLFFVIFAAIPIGFAFRFIRERDNFLSAICVTASVQPLVEMVRYMWTHPVFQ